MDDEQKRKPRRPPTPKVRLMILQRDGYRCTICGANPVTDPGIVLEVDHVEPFSTGGADDETNFQTLCQRCNRGKGNDASLNKSLAADIESLLDRINPEIRQTIAKQGAARVMANIEDFTTLAQKNKRVGTYIIELLPNTVIGSGAGRGMGLYTLNDYGGQKANFIIRPPSRGVQSAGVDSTPNRIGPS